MKLKIKRNQKKEKIDFSINNNCINNPNKINEENKENIIELDRGKRIRDIRDNENINNEKKSEKIRELKNNLLTNNRNNQPDNSMKIPGINYNNNDRQPQRDSLDDSLDDKYATKGKENKEIRDDSNNLNLLNKNREQKRYSNKEEIRED